ncbi:inner membrane protein [Paenibacillus catalpae]|uniref:Inner membrane protein n=1 Tax=Paenibacillus catalpae TaxID=1045775 RepID=A0A1I2FWC3_9BACL|nr:metal-dependent hydrolase [Paenibacillus catalpae]SFF09714.1 inner membrane protein [Paenibacillus catalpae]
MDTGSHLLFGATLGGLAMLNPAVAVHPAIGYAVLAGTVIGSHAPDFDVFARLKGKAAYIRNHRGISHSVPAPLIWAAAIGLSSAWLFGVMEHVLLVMFWTLAAVCFHIVLDLFNTYGVQCLRPFSRKWWHLDALCLFDPYLFGAHLIGLICWMLGVLPPGPLFACIYVLTFVYIAVRLRMRWRVRRRLKLHLGSTARITLVPSLAGGSWQFTADCGDCYRAGTISGSQIHLESTVLKHEPSEHTPVVKAAMEADGVKAFLGFAEQVHLQVEEKQDGYEVSWKDVRFWRDNRMAFGVEVTLDRDMKVLGHHVGWSKRSWESPHV